MEHKIYPLKGTRLKGLYWRVLLKPQQQFVLLIFKPFQKIEKHRNVLILLNGLKLP